MENIPLWFIDLIESIYYFGYDGGSMSDQDMVDYWNGIKEYIKENN